MIQNWGSFGNYTDLYYGGFGNVTYEVSQSQAGVFPIVVGGAILGPLTIARVTMSGTSGGKIIQVNSGAQAGGILILDGVGWDFVPNTSSLVLNAVVPIVERASTENVSADFCSTLQTAAWVWSTTCGIFNGAYQDGNNTHFFTFGPSAVPGGGNLSPAVDLRLRGNDNAQGNNYTDDWHIQPVLDQNIGEAGGDGSTLVLQHTKRADITFSPRVFIGLGQPTSGMTTAQIPYYADWTPNGSAQGTTGSTSYSYVVVSMGGCGGAASLTKTISNGNASLSSNNYNAITWQTMPGAVSYNVYRTAGGATQGLIAQVPATPVAPGASAQHGVGDTGLAGDGTTPQKVINIDCAYATVHKSARKAVVVLALSGPTP